jgi:hypothetical protein
MHEFSFLTQYRVSCPLSGNQMAKSRTLNDGTWSVLGVGIWPGQCNKALMGYQLADTLSLSDMQSISRLSFSDIVVIHSPD